MAFEETSKGPEKAKPTPPSVEIETTCCPRSGPHGRREGGSEGHFAATRRAERQVFSEYSKNFTAPQLPSSALTFFNTGKQGARSPEGHGDAKPGARWGGESLQKESHTGGVLHAPPTYSVPHSLHVARGGGGGGIARFEFGWKFLCRCRCRRMRSRSAFRALSSNKQ